jgi:hypothetical protein
MAFTGHFNSITGLIVEEPSKLLLSGGLPICVYTHTSRFAVGLVVILSSHHRQGAGMVHPAESAPYQLIEKAFVVVLAVAVAVAFGGCLASVECLF